MKTILLALVLLFSVAVNAQITTPVIKAGFGVDADLRANYFNGFVQSGNDDWYNMGNPGTGQFVIDTNGAAFIKAGYLTDVSPYPKRQASFFRTMAKPSFSVINNRLWLDALFVRDYHGTDTTAFVAGSDKNGMSPAYWSGGIQGVPDKNDILDMFMHVRRAGPTPTDSLWFFGGLSIDNITGNRYFDFEMYQTDIYYDRPSGKWYGYGPDAGHSSWTFDGAGNVIRPGDIIFSAEYQSASLTNIEARIWVSRAVWSTSNPTAFAWSGQFDGGSSGSAFGYASILPKTGGTFYTGLQCGNGEWAGPFSVVLQDNTVATNYIAKQFMEFSVNLTKLGLDPVTTFGTDVCGTPFNRIVVKTRASASFTAELKDFVAPTDLFLAPRVLAAADVPIFCGFMGVSNVFVSNPFASSVYTWSTLNGNIVGTTTGPSIMVDTPGTYIVMQQLTAGCNPYAYDTVTVTYDSTCTVLAGSLQSFKGSISAGQAALTWTMLNNNDVGYFEIERSADGRNFETVARVNAIFSGSTSETYNYRDDISALRLPYVYYRLKIRSKIGGSTYSNLLKLSLPIADNEALIYPNPADDVLQLALSSDRKQDMKLMVYDFTGALVDTRSLPLKQGTNVFSINTLQWKEGVYVLQLTTMNRVIRKKLIVNRQLLVN
jgi:Secretion system C-terminal sorting domain